MLATKVRACGTFFLAMLCVGGLVTDYKAMAFGGTCCTATKEQADKPISRESAIRIANRHFRRADDAACYVEDRGADYFVAPPLKRRSDLEKTGVIVSKQTGEIRKK